MGGFSCSTLYLRTYPAEYFSKQSVHPLQLIERSGDVIGCKVKCFVMSCHVSFLYDFRISGGELFERVINDDFILTEKACVMFMRQICEGIEFMHNNSILHLDLKVRSSFLFSNAAYLFTSVWLLYYSLHKSTEIVSVNSIKRLFDMKL